MSKPEKLLPKDDPKLVAWTRIAAILEEAGAPKTKKFPLPKAKTRRKGNQS